MTQKYELRVSFYKEDTELCSYCRLQDETANPVSVKCKFAIKLWSDLKDIVSVALIFQF